MSYDKSTNLIYESTRKIEERTETDGTRYQYRTVPYRYDTVLKKNK